MIAGNVTVGEGFDIVAGQTMIAAGGAMGATSFAKKSVKSTGYRKLCKRSIMDEPQAMLFNDDFNQLPQNFDTLLPRSFSVRFFFATGLKKFLKSSDYFHGLLNIFFRFFLNRT